ncbi:ParB N-terminal domain-containing protein [Campylobacter sp. JMF_03 NE3]|uniref:ParB N-terminal domain-containing protein n=1 Tax=Campylobacter sp. JMF_03 NE3 TaxID=2983831 RepID=UPI0022E9D527|nr:ParB N-terminal domain-containing protein [Campylobacter sp. JMF_03 NE3]MDA3053609.1 ParB N-terminal domain-containing protein [Campylobacter sp. JMF_03 NE3]
MAIIYEDLHSINIKEYNIIDILKDRQLNSSFENSEDAKRLYKSIAKHGVLSPLVLFRVDDKTFELISGRRRLNAIKKINNSNDENLKEITDIPVRIIDKQTPKAEVYSIAYNENNIKETLFDYQKIRSVLNMIATHDSYQKYVKNNLADTLYGITEKIKSFNKNKSSNDEESNILHKIIQDVAQKLFVSEPYLIKTIINTELDPQEVFLLSIQNTPLTYDDIKSARLNKKSLDLLNDIKKICEIFNLNDEEDYNALKKILARHKFKLSDFYLIDGIDENYDESKIADVSDDDFGKYVGNLIKSLVEILKQLIANSKIKSNFEKQKDEVKKRFSKILKTANEDDLKRILMLLDGLKTQDE